MDWFEYNKELPLATIKTWREEIFKTAKFTHTGWTGDPREPYRHWCYAPEYKGIYEHIFDCLNHSFKEEGLHLKVDRMLLNVYNHGDSSWLHRDREDTVGWTALLFLNEYWDINWHGHFILVDDNQEIIKAFSPTPGKYIIFKNNILHGATPVSREAQFPRIALAMQCIHENKDTRTIRK